MNGRKKIVGITPYWDDNIQHIPENYIKGIEMFGAEAVMLRYETPLEELERLSRTLDGFLFSGGLDVDPSCYGAAREPECCEPNPPRDAMEMAFIPMCLKQKKPILGICRGIQILNVVFGGTLVQDIPTRFGTKHQMPKDSPCPFAHDVHVVPGTMLYDLTGGDIPVDSYHHQCIDRLGAGLVANAYSTEGFIEGCELPEGDQFLMAVQWHPEITLENDVYSPRIFERFIQAVKG